MRWQKMDDEFLQSLDFVAFDTETTGLWAPSNRIVEIGAVKFRLGQPQPQVFQALVNPQRRIPTETINIHGITDSMVKNAEPIKPVLQAFIDFCGEDSILIAHNALFDISFVGCELDRSSLPLPLNPILDTVDVARKFSPGHASYSLLSLTRALGLGTSQNHRAADDARLVWKMFSLISEKFPYVGSMGDLRRLLPVYSLSQWQEEAPTLAEEYEDIRTAIDEGLRMEIDYQANGRPVQTRIIRPLRVHGLRSSIYVAAFCELAQDERTFRLDRIKRFRLLRSGQ